MPGKLRVQELMTLKTIAETLNQSSDLHPMLDEVLQKLLAVTGLQTGWIFLVSEKPEYTCVADCNLPPALSTEAKRPMRRGGCWCISDYWDGSLERAVNVINCKRLQDAVRLQWGDTQGITHHATVPLMAGGEPFGILNVASPGKNHFTGEELALLESVAYQIGTAVERIRLFQEQRRRAEDYTKLGELSRRLGAVLETERLPMDIVREVNSSFGWPSVALYLHEGADLALCAAHDEKGSRHCFRKYPATRAGAPGVAFRERRTVVVADAEDESRLRARRGQPAYRSAVAVPLRLREEPIGILVVGAHRPRAFAERDIEVVQDLGAHVSLALENARLYRQQQDIARAEERNRLARDLHDSVTQMLFSLMLTARGARGHVTDQPEVTAQALQEMESLSQEALKEMRSLIWQLRPTGLEDGLLTALQRYAQSMNLVAASHVDGLRELPRAVEEALWRIGQESLNNVRKHAHTDQVSISLRMTDTDATLEVADEGVGFVANQRRNGYSLGLKSMRERAQALGGTFTVQSKPGRGTVTRVWIPCLTR